MNSGLRVLRGFSIIVLLSVIMLLGIVAWAIKTDSGRKRISQTIMSAADGVFAGRGSLKIGELRSVTPNNVVARDVAILDTTGAEVLFVKDLNASVSVSEIFAGIIRLRSIELDSVSLNLNQDPGTKFNIQWILMGDSDRENEEPRPPGLGDDIRIDNVVLRNGEISIRYPWEPHPLFTGSQRDSVLRVRDSLHDLEHTGSGVYEKRRVSIKNFFGRNLVAVAPGDDPGSLQIDSASLWVSDPPVPVDDVSATLRWYADSLTFSSDRVQLPQSILSAAGTIAWYEPGPVRYDVVIDAPDVTLADIQWTWPVLPADGKASSKVRLRTLENPDHMEVQLYDLSAAAMGSKVSGEISMTVEPTDFKLHNVGLEFTPLTTELAARLSEDALPEDVEGRIRGRFVARSGGSLANLLIDTLSMEFEDLKTDGAKSRIHLGGTIALGVEPSVRNMRLSDISIDMRSVRTLVPDLHPAAQGLLSGSMTVASASLDELDARDMVIVWNDDNGNESRITGRSAVRLVRGGNIDLDVSFDPLDMAVMADVDTAFPVSGRLTGNLTAVGTTDSVEIKLDVAQMDHSAGQVLASGWAGVTPSDSIILANWRTSLSFNIDGMDMSGWMKEGVVPSTLINGSARLFASGSNAVVDTARISTFINQLGGLSRTPFELSAFASLGSESFYVDSLKAIAPGVVLEADGGLARDSGGMESFRGDLTIDSLSVLAEELPRLANMMSKSDTALASSIRSFASDSMLGNLHFSVYGEGSFKDYIVSVAAAADELQVGDISIGRLFGSFRADGLPGAAQFIAAATADSVEGVASLSIATMNIGIDSASFGGGSLRFDLLGRDDSRIRMRGSFAKSTDTFIVRSDTVRFAYRDIEWLNTVPLSVANRDEALVVDSFSLVSNKGGSFSMAAFIPKSGDAVAHLRLDRFPAGELAAFSSGREGMPGLLSGNLNLSGPRSDPLISAHFIADSIGVDESMTVSGIRLSADYHAQELVGRASMQDTTGRSFSASIRLPADLRIQQVIGERFYTDAIDGEVSADSIRLRDLPLRIPDVSDLDGFLHGHLLLGGTFDQPSAEGRIEMNGGTMFMESLGIRPRNASMVMNAYMDSISIDHFRFQSGPKATDSLHMKVALRNVFRDDRSMVLNTTMNNVQLAHQRDGTDVNLSGSIDMFGPLSRPIVTADLYVPKANLVLDLTEANTVLDLSTPDALSLLSPEELPTISDEASQFSSLGEFLEARDVRIRMGEDVWVRTADAAVKLSGSVTVLEAAGQELSLDGELVAERGTYRLDLGVVSRPFIIDSGRVRFYPQDNLNPALDIHAKHVVRGIDGGDIPVEVAIRGTLEEPLLAFGTSSDAYSRAPESEFISLLVFGAPTFALDGQSQQTVKAVTGVLIPTLSGAVEGTLQRLLPVFNTVQVSSAGGQSGDELGALSLLDNLSVTAGKQIGTKTYLRFDTGVCRSAAGASAARSLNLWYGVAAEYRISAGLTGQIGLDPGPSPCGVDMGMGTSRRMQVGFDLFKEWVF